MHGLLELLLVEELEDEEHELPAERRHGAAPPAAAETPLPAPICRGRLHRFTPPNSRVSPSPPPPPLVMRERERRRCGRRRRSREKEREREERREKL